MAVVAELLVKIAADTAKLTAGLDTTRKQLKTWESNVNRAMGTARKAFATFGIAVGAVELASFVKDSFNAADALKDMSESTGIGVEKLSALAFAGRQSGIDIEQLAKGTIKLSSLLQDFSTGNKEAVDMFERLGVSARNADGDLKSVETLLADVADQFAKMPDGVRKTALAVDLFGEKIGPKLIPLLNNGRSGLDSLVATAKEYGVVMNADAVKAADEFNDQLAVMSGWAKALAADMAPAAASVAKFVTGLVVGAKGGAKIVDTGGLEMLKEGVEAAKQIEESYKEIDKVFGQQIEKEKERKRLDDLEKQRKENEALVGINARWIESEKKLSDAAVARSEKMDETNRKIKQGWEEYDALVKRTNEGIEETYRAETEYAERMRQEREDALQAQDAYADSFGTITDAVLHMGQNFTRTMTEMVMTGKASFKRLGQAFLADFLNVVIHNMLTVPLFKGLFGASAMGGGPIGGIFGGIFGGLFAEGGNPPMNKASIVGERGPELIVPRGPATVIPMTKMGAGASGINIGSIDMRGASVEAVARLETMLKQLNASVERRSVGAVIDDIRRGGPMSQMVGG